MPKKTNKRAHHPSPYQFFEDNVLRSPKTRAHLRLWLTVAKSSYLVNKITFQRPKVYCVTGFYELVGARARSNIGNSNSASANVGSGIGTLIGGVPVGITIGPFENGRILECDTYMKGSNIWAARFHQLDVEYLRKKTGGEPPAPPSTISLLSDYSRRGDMVMGGQEVQESGSTAVSDTDIQEANTVNIGLSEVVDEEVESDPTNTAEYWEVFDRAERRLNR